MSACQSASLEDMLLMTPLEYNTELGTFSLFSIFLLISVSKEKGASIITTEGKMKKKKKRRNLSLKSLYNSRLFLVYIHRCLLDPELLGSAFHAALVKKCSLQSSLHNHIILQFTIPRLIEFGVVGIRHRSIAYTIEPAAHRYVEIQLPRPDKDSQSYPHYHYQKP